MGTDESAEGLVNQHATDTSDFVLHKPQVDKLDYRFITLDNSLKALLICDVEADKAAASMDVRAHPTCSVMHRCKPASTSNARWTHHNTPSLAQTKDIQRNIPPCT